MYIDAYRDTIKACRFCFMCRHLSPIGNVTFREADTPRGRALWLDRALADPRLFASADFQQTIYDADLSAACRRHCVNHYDEAGLVLAARRDLFETGQVPGAVQTLATELAGATVASRGEPAAEVVVYVDDRIAAQQPEIQGALEAILGAAGVAYRVVASADSGKALLVLGDHAGARRHAAKVAAAIAGGGVRLVVTSSPAAYDAFGRDYPALGAPLGPGVEIQHSSDFILRLLADGRLKCRPAQGLRIISLASDFLRNYAESHDSVARVLGQLGVEAVPFGTNREESYTAGEGAVVLDRLNPRLVEKLSRHVAGRVEHPADDLLLAMSPYTKYALRTFGGAALRLTTLEEVVRQLVL